jgi:hypothetical protein
VPVAFRIRSMTSSTRLIEAFTVASLLFVSVVAAQEHSCRQG